MERGNWDLVIFKNIIFLKTVELTYMIKEISVYKNLRVSDLRDIAKSRGLRGWTKLRKDDLISFIADNEEYPTDRVTEHARKMGKRTIKELKTLA